ncbi:MAG: hypothetical protein QOF77_1441 [Solirubrobacteraceae bacterium]|jgi:hypothetical protein|nr:hypothetical protein [Solirubrobacteraceae bacterium]
MAETGPGRTTSIVRYGIPGGLALIGLVILAADQSSTGFEGFGMFVGAAGAVLLLNVLYRIGARGDFERDDEESARAHFDVHGDWPAAPASAGRRWSLPAGVVTLEAEEAAAGDADAGGGRRTGAEATSGGPDRRPEPGTGASRSRRA